MRSNPLVTVLVIIGAVVVLGFVLKLAFKLIGLAIAVGVVLVLFYFVRGMMGRRP